MDEVHCRNSAFPPFPLLGEELVGLACTAIHL